MYYYSQTNSSLSCLHPLAPCTAHACAKAASGAAVTGSGAQPSQTLHKICNIKPIFLFSKIVSGEKCNNFFTARTYLVDSRLCLLFIGLVVTRRNDPVASKTPLPKCLYSTVYCILLEVCILHRFARAGLGIADYQQQLGADARPQGEVGRQGLLPTCQQTAATKPNAVTPCSAWFQLFFNFWVVDDRFQL
jgi:hypothetical protein